MEKVLLYITVFLTIGLYSCLHVEEKPQPKIITHYSDFEELSKWDEMQGKITTREARSGKHSTYVDTSSGYSAIYFVKIKDLSPKGFSKLKAEAFFRLNSDSSHALMIMEVWDSTMNKLDYKTFNIHHEVKHPRIWTKKTWEIDLEKYWKKDDEIMVRFYMNHFIGALDITFMDDLSIEYIP
jgi:hypothetical protein